MILSTVTIKYIGIIVIKNPSSESGLVPSPSLLQKYSLTGVTSFEVYVSDVIGRRFEKVKNGHIFENWTPIRGLDVDLSLTYIYIYITV
jgi:hypothetical protein